MPREPAYVDERSHGWRSEVDIRASGRPGRPTRASGDGAWAAPTPHQTVSSDQRPKSRSRRRDGGDGAKASHARRKPPLTGMTWPVTKAASSDANHATAAATSSGVPHLPSTLSRTARRCQASLAPAPHAVRIQPGATQLTRTCGASVRARLRVNAITAPFDRANNPCLAGDRLLVRNASEAACYVVPLRDAAVERVAASRTGR